MCIISCVYVHHLIVCPTGNVSKAKALPALEQYLASIPSPTASSSSALPSITLHQIKALPWSQPPSPVVEDVEVDMVSPMTQSQITLPAVLSRPVVREELIWADLACQLLEARLLKVCVCGVCIRHKVACSRCVCIRDRKEKALACAACMVTNRRRRNYTLAQSIAPCTMGVIYVSIQPLSWVACWSSCKLIHLVSARASQRGPESQSCTVSTPQLLSGAAK